MLTNILVICYLLSSKQLKIKMFTKIKTPLLCWTAICFVIFSILQIDHFKFSSFRSFVSFLWKSVIVGVLVYSFIFGDPYLVTVGEAVTYDGKPLIKALDQFEATFSYPFTCIATIIYFNINGRKIVQLLDELGSFVKRVNNQKLVFTIYFLFLQCFFVFGCGNMFFKYIKFERFSQKPIQSLANWLTIYIQYFAHILPLITYHFVHYSLLKLVTDVSNHCDQLSAVQIRSKLKQYSSLNVRINAILSAPLLMFIVSNTVNSIVCTTLLSTDDEYGIFIFITFLFFYQFFVASLLYQTRVVLQKISLRLYSSSLEKKQLIIFRELQCYEEYFKLKIFSLINFDKNFVFYLSLFILNYCIILLQTKK